MNKHRCYCITMSAIIFVLAAVPRVSALSDKGKELLGSLRAKVQSRPASTTTLVTPDVTKIPTTKISSPASTGFTIFSESKNSDTFVPVTEPEKKRISEKVPEQNTLEDSQSILKEPPQLINIKPNSNSSPSLEAALEELETLKKRLKPQEAVSDTKPAVKEKTLSKKTSINESQQSQINVADTTGETGMSEKSARSFGELSDAELIEYAQKHVWSAERTKKHNPPPTPSTTKKLTSKSSVSKSKNTAKGSEKTIKATVKPKKNKTADSQKTTSSAKAEKKATVSKATSAAAKKASK